MKYCPSDEAVPPPPEAVLVTDARVLGAARVLPVEGDADGPEE